MGMILFFVVKFVGTARKLARSGYGVFAMDFPGFGLSEGLHGYIPSFDKLVDDVVEHYSKVKGMIFMNHFFLIITTEIESLTPHFGNLDASQLSTVLQGYWHLCALVFCY